MGDVSPNLPRPSGLIGRWLQSLLVMAVAGAAAWIMVGMDMRCSALGALTVAIAFVIYRAGVNATGVALWGLAVAVIVASRGVPMPEVSSALCVLAGLLLLLASSIACFVAAVNDRARRGRNCACCSLALFTLIAGLIVGNKLNGHLQYQASIQHTTDTLITLHELSLEIESLRSRLGRLPEDEEELIALRGEPMPTFYLDSQIHYYRDDADHYGLHCCLSDFWGHARDLFGWLIQYRDPESPQRIHATRF